MSNDIYVVEYSTITVFNVWDYYVTKDGTPSTGNLTISLADYQDAECDKDFAIMKNDVVCTDNTLKWTKTFTTSPTFTGDAANVENYSIVADPVTGEWKVKFNKPKEGGTTPTTGTGTLKFQLTYPETEAITPCTGYTLPSFTVAVTVQ